ncbi:hypothetical protein AX16_001990 [Volvariella volvacea WC 439]|nr:hypothetical protein AX16_001990 [Volvariella volvacea WC 439]
MAQQEALLNFQFHRALPLPEAEKTSGNLNALMFCPNGLFLAAAYDDGHLFVWKTTYFELVLTHHTVEVAVKAMSWANVESPEYSTLFVGLTNGDVIRLGLEITKDDPSANNPDTPTELLPKVIRHVKGYILALEVLSTDQVVVAFYDKGSDTCKIQVLKATDSDSDPWEVFFTVEPPHNDVHARRIHCIKGKDTSSFIVTFSNEEHIIYCCQSGRTLGTLPNKGQIGGTALSPDAKHLAATSPTEKIRWYDTTKRVLGEASLSYKPSDTVPLGIEFLDKETVVTGYSDGQIALARHPDDDSNNVFTKKIQIPTLKNKTVQFVSTGVTAKGVHLIAAVRASVDTIYLLKEKYPLCKRCKTTLESVLPILSAKEEHLDTRVASSSSRKGLTTTTTRLAVKKELEDSDLRLRVPSRRSCGSLGAVLMVISATVLIAATVPFYDAAITGLKDWVQASALPGTSTGKSVNMPSMQHPQHVGELVDISDVSIPVAPADTMALALPTYVTIEIPPTTTTVTDTVILTYTLTKVPRGANPPIVTSTILSVHTITSTVTLPPSYSCTSTMYVQA